MHHNTISPSRFLKRWSRLKTWCVCLFHSSNMRMHCSSDGAAVALGCNYLILALVTHLPRCGSAVPRRRIIHGYSIDRFHHSIEEKFMINLEYYFWKILAHFFMSCHLSAKTSFSVSSKDGSLFWIGFTIHRCVEEIIMINSGMLFFERFFHNFPSHADCHECGFLWVVVFNASSLLSPQVIQ